MINSAIKRTDGDRPGLIVQMEFGPKVTAVDLLSILNGKVTNVKMGIRPLTYSELGLPSWIARVEDIAPLKPNDELERLKKVVGVIVHDDMVPYEIRRWVLYSIGGAL